MKKTNKNLKRTSTKRAMKYSYFALSEIGPILADLLTICKNEKYIYRERINGELIQSEIVRESDNVLEIDFGEFVSCKWPTYSFLKLKDKKIKFAKSLQNSDLKKFITYVIAYKIKYNYLYLDEYELQRLERKYINKDITLRLLEKLGKIKFDLEKKIEQQKVSFVEPKVYKLDK